jgi:hypothetical protein
MVISKYLLTIESVISALLSTVVQQHIICYIVIMQIGKNEQHHQHHIRMVVVWVLNIIIFSCYASSNFTALNSLVS